MRGHTDAVSLGKTINRETHKAYLAGLIDGEGCITVLRRRKVKRGKVYIFYEPHIIISNTNRQLIEFIRATYPGMVTTQRTPSYPNAKPVYRYAATRDGTKRMAKQLEPYLMLKKSKQSSYRISLCFFIADGREGHNRR